MEESCKLYLITDGNPKNLSEDNLASMGAYTVFGKDDRAVSVGDGLKMSIVREEMMDEPVQLKIVHIEKGAPKKLILCRARESK